MTLLLCVFAGLATTARAQVGAASLPPAATQARVVGSPAATGRASGPFAIADFDGDSLPDFATISAGATVSAGATLTAGATVTAGSGEEAHTRYWIRVQLSSGVGQAIGITAPWGGLHLAQRDVNGDSFLDLVVTTQWQRHPVAVLLNDGHGNFTVHDPSRYRAAISESPRHWTAAGFETRDATAALLTGNFSGDSEAQAWQHAAPQESALLASRDNSRLPSSLATLVFGRAPPF